MKVINAMMNQVALEQLEPGPPDRVLEIGFGPGSLLDQLLARSSYVAGLDLSPIMAKVTRQRLGSRVKACCGDALALPFAEGTFTRICTVNTVYFWEDLRQAFVECRRVLRSEGVLVVCFNASHELERESWGGYGFILHTEEAVISSMRAAGFTRIERRADRDPEQGEFFCLRGSTPLSISPPPVRQEGRDRENARHLGSLNHRPGGTKMTIAEPTPIRSRQAANGEAPPRRPVLNIALWVVQVLLALLFIWAGGFKLVMPLEKLAGPPGSVVLPGAFLRFIGVAELLGGIGLILPGLLRIRPGLTPLAAAGLVIIMIGAVGITFAGGGAGMALMPAVTGLLAAFVAYGRWRLVPIRPKS